MSCIWITNDLLSGTHIQEHIIDYVIQTNQNDDLMGLVRVYLCTVSAEDQTDHPCRISRKLAFPEEISNWGKYMEVWGINNLLLQRDPKKWSLCNVRHLDSLRPSSTITNMGAQERPMFRMSIGTQTGAAASAKTAPPLPDGHFIVARFKMFSRFYRFGHFRRFILTCKQKLNTQFPVKRRQLARNSGVTLTAVAT